MLKTTRKAVIAAAIVIAITCMGADSPFKFKSSKDELADRVESLEKQNAELRRQVADLETKVELLTQRVNIACGQAGGSFQQNRTMVSGPPPSTPNGLEVVRLQPERKEPARPKGKLIVTSSNDETTSLIEHGAPLPGTNYVPLPDPENAVSASGPAKSPETPKPAAESMASPTPVPSNPSDSSPSENSAYQKIVELRNSGDAAGAAALMEEYLKSYSNGVHADDVAYWLGQYYYSIAERKKAIEAFRIVTDDHTTSSNAPEALYMIGLAYLELGRNDDAADALREVKILYPFSDAAQKAEEKLSSCCQ